MLQAPTAPSLSQEVVDLYKELEIAVKMNIENRVDELLSDQRIVDADLKLSEKYYIEIFSQAAKTGNLEIFKKLAEHPKWTPVLPIIIPVIMAKAASSGSFDLMLQVLAYYGASEGYLYMFDIFVHAARTRDIIFIEKLLETTLFSDYYQSNKIQVLNTMANHDDGRLLSSFLEKHPEAIAKAVEDPLSILKGATLEGINRLLRVDDICKAMAALFATRDDRLEETLNDMFEYEIESGLNLLEANNAELALFMSHSFVQEYIASFQSNQFIEPVAFSGNNELLKILLDKLPSDQSDEFVECYDNILELSVYSRNVATFQLVTSTFRRLSPAIEESDSILKLASEIKDFAMFQEILKYPEFSSIDARKLALVIACQVGCEEIVDSLLKYSSIKDASHAIYFHNKVNFAPLHMATANGHLNIVKKLLEIHDYRETELNQLLEVLAQTNHVAIMDYLVQNNLVNSGLNASLLIKSATSARFLMLAYLLELPKIQNYIDSDPNATTFLSDLIRRVLTNLISPPWDYSEPNTRAPFFKIYNSVTELCKVHGVNIYEEFNPTQVSVWLNLAPSRASLFDVFMATEGFYDEFTKEAPTLLFSDTAGQEAPVPQSPNHNATISERPRLG